jgi:hypothetical protein
LQEETFTLPIFYKNEHRDYPATLQVFGYTHKIVVRVGEQDILFEPDEEKNYRAVLPVTPEGRPQADIELLQAIAATLEEAFK